TPLDRPPAVPFVPGRWPARRACGPARPVLSWSGRVRLLPAAQPGDNRPGRTSWSAQRQRGGRMVGRPGTGRGGRDVLLRGLGIHRRGPKTVGSRPTVTG